ncbi:glycosyltransferase [Psychrobacter faecalis]|uniref:Glycosyltransferase n=1 Tax=Psychrobacter faecalis TaxID=180588 RepID=A0ABT9HIV2_9GAMM|nr:glycosyltransferase [Psychrobacter faecalis]MDP4545696.1 glycosyltransferase [Psychrobacter faecalis]
MKIVHIITGLNNGGAEGVLYRLVTHDQDNEHIVISMMDAGKYGPMLLDKGVKLYCLNMDQGKFSPKAIVKLYKILKKTKPNVVQTWMYHADLIGGLTAKIAGVKNIFWNLRHTSFDSDHTKASTIKIARLNAKLSKIIPKKIISCAQAAVKTHTDLGYDEEKIVVIGNGYDLSTFKIDDDSRNLIRDELNIGKNPVIGMVGRYDPQKNHKGLIEALAIVKKNGYVFDLILVGRDLNEKNKTLLSQIRKSGLYEQTHLLDQRNDIPSIMNALDLHVLSSSYGEGFPNVIAEAMACGTPCIATDVGDSKKIIDSFGVVIPPNNVPALSNAIISFLNLMKSEQEWNAFRINGKNHIRSNFSIEVMISNYRKIWSDKD